LHSRVGACYNGRMSNPNHHHEGECCGCGRLAPIDATELCVTCTENLNALIDEREEREGPVMRLASGNANPDEEPEYAEPHVHGWEDDNDWLASAGWGEM